jgi:hypothetical protein
MIAQVLNTAIIFLLVVLVVVPAAMALTKTLRQHMARRRLAQARRAVPTPLDRPGAR